MTSQTDQDQGGINRQTYKQYLGPSIGWVTVPMRSVLNITAAGTYNVDLSISLITVNVAGTVILNLPSVLVSGAGAGAVPGPSIQNPIAIVDNGGNAGGFPITAVAAGGQNIDGLANVQISSSYGALVLTPNSQTSNWVATAATQAQLQAPTNWYQTRAFAQGSVIPAALTFIQTAGYNNIGDWGQANYKKVGGSTTGGFQSVDGAWWQPLGDRAVTVQEFGADLTGAADSTSAINNAISYASSLGGGTVLFAPGFYLTTSNIVIPDGVVLHGMGGTKGVTVPNVFIFTNNNITMFTASGSGWGLHSLYIAPTNKAAIGLDITGSNGYCTNCTFEGGNTTGVRVRGATGNNASFNVFIGLTARVQLNAYGLMLDGDVTANACFNQFIGPTFIHGGSATPSTGIYLGDCDGNTFFGMMQTGSGSGNRGILFDFNNVGGNVFPNSNMFFNTNMGLPAANQFLVGGSPSVNLSPNGFYGLTRNNGQVPPILTGKIAVYDDTRAKKYETVLVSELDTPTNNAGATSMVRDANANTFNSVVVGGGANVVPVFCDGSSWRIG